MKKKKLLVFVGFTLSNHRRAGEVARLVKYLPSLKLQVQAQHSASKPWWQEPVILAGEESSKLRSSLAVQSLTLASWGHLIPSPNK